jgi:S-(hydroxymethyl)glutathione dehydrogenase/alcohol dehydrogenase
MICGRQLRGSWGGESVPDRDVPIWADLYLRGKLPLNALITHRFPFEKINDAFALLASGSAGRIIIEMDRLS